MPLYDYRCEDCLTVFEVHATFKEKDAGLEPECPQCHGRETRQLLTSGLLIHIDGGASREAPVCIPHSHSGPGCCGG